MSEQCSHSQSHFPYGREELLRLRSEIVELQGLLKEEKSAEAKEKESTDASGESSDGHELRKTVEAQRAEVKGHHMFIRLWNERGDRNFHQEPDAETPVTTCQPSVSTTKERESQQSKGHSHSRKAKQHLTRHEVRFTF